MKHVCGFLILATLSVPVLADPGISNMNEGLNLLSNPQSMGLLECDDVTNPWCKNLHASACEITKSTNKLGQLRSDIEAQTYKKLPKTPLKSQINDAAQSAIKLADELVHKQGKLIRKDVIDTFTDTKSILYNVVTSNNFLTPQKKTEITKTIEKINLRTGSEYVDELIAYGKKQDPKASIDELKRTALSAYVSSCGLDGLEVNAFFTNGNIVICPGLIYSLEDFASKGKQDILNALSFTIGHEIGHSFDYSDQPTIYSKMRACYETLTNSPTLFDTEMGNEIVGDYWGTLVMGQRLKNQKVKGTDALRTVAMSIDGFCAPPPADKAQKPQVHPEALFRVNFTIARAPLMREALGCEAPTKSNPACWLDGILQKNPNIR